MHCEGNSRAVQRGWGRDGQGVVVAVYLLFCSRSEGGTVELGGGVVVVEEHQIRSREESREILMRKILTFFLLQAQGRTDSELELKLKKVREQTGGRWTDGFLKGEEDRPCRRPWRCVASLVWQIWGGATRKTGQAGRVKMRNNIWGTHRARS